MVTLLFSVHTNIEAKQYTGLGRAVDLPARSFDLARPGVAPPLPTLPWAGDAMPKEPLIQW